VVAVRDGFVSAVIAVLVLCGGVFRVDVDTHVVTSVVEWFGSWTWASASVTTWATW
jgi:hypothetical protein